MNDEAKECAKWLAKLAAKWAKFPEEDGDTDDVQNNLDVVLKALEPPDRDIGYDFGRRVD